jgi:membrane protease YdiL (CAAX protease family)
MNDPTSGSFRLQAATGWSVTMIVYFPVTFVMSWAAWIGAGVIAPDASGPHGIIRTVLIYVGTFAPALVALTMTAIETGRAGVGTLIRRLFQADMAPRWYAFAIGYMFSVKLTMAAVHRLVWGNWPPFSHEPIVLLFAASIFSTVLLGQAGEELGWRGYALPRLAARLGYARSSLIIGTVWALWHLPLFYITGTDKTGQAFPIRGLSVVALSVAITWLYARTGGSLLLTMLMHAATNNLGSIVSGATPGATHVWTLRASPMMTLTLVGLWIPAAWLLVKMPCDAAA